MKISVIIPNWNGKELLEKNLPAVVAAKPDEIIIVDDASPDNSNEFLLKNYPQVKIVYHQKNRGFSAACNSGVRAANGDYVVLLNTDVVPEKDCFQNVVKNFDNKNVFAVSFNEPTLSWAKIFWKNGYIGHEVGEKVNKIHISGWASGGSAIFRKSYWEELGGFDEIYQPFYREDMDLSYRAWKRGYQILWDPCSIVRHEHQSVIGKHFSRNYIDFISERNLLIFIWKNITDEEMIRENIKGLGFRLRHPGYIKVILSAFTKLPSILSRRSIEIKNQKVSDQDILALFT